MARKTLWATDKFQMKHTFLIIAFFISATVFAQFSKSNAKITDAAGGNTLVTLNDSVKIAIGVQQTGWYPVTTKAIVPKSAVTGDSVLPADTELLNRGKDPIGKVKSETKVQYQQAEGRGLYKYYEVIIKGFIKGTDLHYRSIPERGIEEILEDARMAGRAEKFANYFKKLGFIKEEHSDFTVYIYLDDVATFDQPTYRTIVIFRGETALYGIVSRSEFMSMEKLKDEREHSTGHYYFFQRPPDRTWEEIKDIVYGFIPL